MIPWILDHHAQEAAFLWELRDGTVRSFRQTFAGLRRLDERIEGHLDGLSLGRAQALDGAVRRAGDAPGQTFVAAMLVLAARDLPGVARVLDRAGRVLSLVRALVSALAWAKEDDASGVLGRLLAPSCPPALHALGIAASSARRVDPGPVLGDALRSEDVALRTCALRAVGRLGASAHLPATRAALDAADAHERFAAAYAGVVLGDPASLTVLGRFASASGPGAERAADLVMRAAPASLAPTLFDSIAAVSERTAISAAEARGDSIHLPWLLERARVTATARVAGRAIATIFGLDLVEKKLDRPRPPGFEEGPDDNPAHEDVAVPPDADLPWPDPDALAAACAARRDVAPGTRCLFGRPVEADRMREVLRDGRQHHRAAAALELALAERGAPFEVRAPGRAQLAALTRH